MLFMLEMALEDKMDARMKAIHVKAFVSTIITAGDYNCTCPHGTYGDGRKNGKGCIKNNVEFPIIKATLGNTLFLGCYYIQDK